MLAVMVLLLGLSAQAADEPALSIQARLVATIGIGDLVDIDLADIHVHARAEDTDYAGHVLARSALTVLGEDQGFQAWPLARLLDRTLDQLTYSHGSVADLGFGFHPEHLVFVTVYALVMTGDEEAAVEVLANHVDSRVPYKRAVALQALRFIGGKPATEVIQLAAQDGSGNLADNLLADHHYPFVIELAQRADLIAAWNRDIPGLLGAAGQPCSQQGSLAVYWLGLLHETAHDGDEVHGVLESLTRAPCFYTRHFARRSLALHRKMHIDFWMDLYLDEKDAWQRALLVRILFAHHAQEFLPVSLDMLDSEPSQYVQWELMHGNLRLRRGGRWRTYWDIWWAPTTQFLIDHRDGGRALPAPELDRLLGWLESGAAPDHPWVRNHLLYSLAGDVHHAHTRRFLEYVDSLPEKSELWWLLQPLQDPAALPMLTRWAEIPASPQQATVLQQVIERLSAE